MDFLVAIGTFLDFVKYLRYKLGVTTKKLRRTERLFFKSWILFVGDVIF